MAYDSNLIKFISTEENNLLMTMVSHHAEIQQFAVVDGHFQAPVNQLNMMPASDNHGRTLLALYLFTHYHLNLSFVTLMRCHLSDSLASTRKAIDATLTAYRLWVEPDTLNDYLEAKAPYKFIKRTIERKRKADTTAYPLAVPLLSLHDTCSEFGSHADISSFAHRIKVVPLGSGEASVEHLMFQYPEDPVEFRYYLASTLSAYALMLGIFIKPVAKYAEGFDVETWEKSLAALTASIEKVRTALAKAGLESKSAAEGAAP